ncbi:phosphohistidine phosphatase SixA, partial [bacterium]
MFVILVRHGRAESGYTNPERPLTSKGKNDIEMLGKYLYKESVQVDQVWHSGICRAQQTAEILAKHLSFKNDLIQMSNLSPNSNPETIRIALNAEAKNILLVSHLPFIDYLSNLMITGNMEADLIHFPPGSAAKLIK